MLVVLGTLGVTSAGFQVPDLGRIPKALTTALTGSSLLEGPIRIEDHGLRVDEACIEAGPRVGVDYAGEDAGRPYRFRLEAGGCR